MKYLLLTALFIVIFNNQLIGQNDDPDYIKGVEYFNKANAFKKAYKLDSAYVNFEKAAVYFHKKNAEKYIGNYINSKYSAADVLIHQSKFFEASEILDEIEPLAKEKFGDKNQYMMRILYGRGTVDFYLGKNNNAINYYKKSLALSEELLGEDNLYSAQVISGLGNAYSVAGRYKLALEQYKKDLAVRKKNVGVNHPSLAASYNNLSVAYESLGDYKQAEKYIDKAIFISLKNNGEMHPETAVYYSGKGNICFRKGQNDLALDYFNKALGIEKNIYGEMHKKTADELNNIGLVYKAKHEYDKALIAFKDAYEIQKKVLGEQHPDVAATCNNIGYILDKQGKPESSLSFYKEAIDIKTIYFGKNHPELAVYYNNIGLNYANRDKADEALENYLKSAKIYEYNFGKKYTGLMITYINIADIYRRKKQYEEALLYYQKSLAANVKQFTVDTANLAQNPPVKQYSDIHTFLLSVEGKAKTYGALYVRDSLRTEAENSYNCYLSCDTAINTARRLVEKQSDKITLANQTKTIYEDAVIAAAGLAYITDKERKKNDYKLQAFYFSEKNKASVLADAVSASEAKEFAGIPQKILDQERELKINIAAVEQKRAESSNREDINRYDDELFALNRQLQIFNKQIEQKYPKYFESKYKNTVIDVSDLQKYLDKETALRSYFNGRKVLIIFTITKNSISLTSVDKPDNFDEDIKNYVRLASSGIPRDFPIYAEQAYRFYEKMFPEKQSDNIKNIIIIPDGILGMLPFESFFTEKYQGDIMNFKAFPYLIKQKRISYYYSAYMYYKAVTADKIRNDKRIDWLGIAPVFSNIANRKVNGIELSELPGSEIELQKIRNLYTEASKKSKVLLKTDATETIFKARNLKNYKILHIATHGIVNPEYPELSGIFMYPEKTQNDGILYSGEIYNLKLNADLVVLSACETGLGKVSKSEGIIGLSRALLYAGADNVIVSLWKVSDSSTSQLMVDFYDNVLTKKENYADALRDAKLKMINGGGNYAHPFFWSPFILIGD